jgi:hypothetical protein
MNIIRVKIDVTKLDKTAFFRGGKGVYADITLLENRDGPDRFGNDFMVVQDLGEDRRKAGEKGAILGNAKYVQRGGQQQAAPVAPRPVVLEDDGEEIPF